MCRMKVAMIGHKKIPSRLGGVEVVVEKISEGLVKRGVSVTAFNRRLNSKDKKNYIYKGIRVKTVPTIMYRGISAASSSLFASLYVAIKPFDIVHYHAEGPAAMLWIPKIFRKKVLVTIHGLDYKRDKWGKLGQKYIEFGEWCVAKFADNIIVLNKETQNYFKNKYNRSTVYIPNGISKPNILLPNELAKYNLKKDEYILFLGRIVPEKGIENLIKAFKKLKTTKKLVIAGGASDTNGFFNKMKQMASSDNRIIFTGFVDGNLLSELYSNAYLYVLPSKLEGMPIGLMEAMAFGNCCLVSDIPECKNVVMNHGIVFKNNDFNDLYLKLEELVKNPKKVEMLKSKSADYILNKYQWTTVINKTLELYKESINENTK